jgi:NADP-dependent 3-hydroxy acid dehydrogenase YdfG
MIETRLHGTVAFVTDSSSGIGAATARSLAEEGAAVALVACRGERIDELASTIRGEGGTALVLEADVTQRRQIEAAVERTVRQLGRLDTVVNNAGVMLLGAALDSPPEEWDRMIALNLQGTLYVTRVALPHLVRAAADSHRKVADVVYISSTAGRVARPGTSVYSLTKFGIAAFADSIRQELIATRVRVSVVEPGAVANEYIAHLREGVRGAAQSHLNSIEALLPEDVADAVTYIVTRDRRVAVNELLVRASEQNW